MKGFFTQGRYFLMPADCRDVAELRSKYEDRPLAVTELFEEKCLAPYFSAEAAKSTVLTLREGNAVYPCEVQILSQKEYNDRLREIIPAFCEGCPYYGGIDASDESLEGHHEEVSLNRVCFHRAEARALQVDGDVFDFYHVDEWIALFVLRFPIGELERLIDGGEHERAAKLFCDTLFERVHCVIPPVWFRKRDEKYEFYCTTFTDEHDGLVMEYICKCLTERYGKTWDFYHYIPKGLDIPEAIKPLGVIASLLQNVEPSLEMKIFVDKGEVNQAYYWLCSTYGEMELQKLATPLDVQEMDPDEPIPVEAADPDTLSELFDELLPEIRYDEHRAPASHVIFYSPSYYDMDMADEEKLADGGFYSFRCSYLCDRFVMPIHMDEPLENVWKDLGTVTDLSLPIARFVFTASPLDASRPADEKGVAFMRETAEFFDHMARKGLFLLFAQVTRYGVSEQFGIVLNHTSFLYEARYFAPLFLKHPAELYLYTATKQSGGHYRLGFDMRLLEKESELWKNN